MADAGTRMTTPSRIPFIMGRLMKVWQRHPELRLGQLLLQVSTSLEAAEATGVYYTEDEDLIDRIEKYYDR